MRKLLIILLCCTVVGLAGYAGYRSYKVWKQQHLLAMAREFYAKGDSRDALLSLRGALAANPHNLAATRLTAEVLEAGRSREALLWRALVVELDPKSTDDRLALARAGMMFNDYSVATNALAGVSEADQKTVAYQNIAGAVAAEVNLFPEAKEHFLEAARLDPNNPVLQLNLAVVDFHGTNETAIAQARATLQRLSLNATNANLRCQALRELVIDAMRFKHEDSALALSKELLQETNAAFSDRLLRLEVLQGTRSADFKPVMVTFEKEASTNAAKIYELASWQQSHRQVPEGLRWLQSLPPDTRTNQPAALLIAEFDVMQQDWPGLQRSLEHEKWGGSDFIRHALMARALRGQELLDSSKGEWEQALKVAGAQKMSRMMLLRMAAQWGWRAETEDMLWVLVNQYPGERGASQALTQLLFAEGRTRSLLELFNQELKARPSDILSKNNLAMTALLLDAKEYNPNNLALEVYEKSPTNASFASTYAFSLLLQKKNAQALSVIEQLKEKELENPSISGYYGLILQANGNRAKAKKYLSLSTKAPHLPEEQKLFEMAKSRA